MAAVDGLIDPIVHREEQEQAEHEGADEREHRGQMAALAQHGLPKRGSNQRRCQRQAPE